MAEDEAMERTRRLLDERIIREITPIFDTTALGYSSMLVAAKVDSRAPAARRARSSTSTPASRTTTCATTTSTSGSRSRRAPDSKLGLDGTLDVLKELSGAESIRQLPTLTMFKINMNLEMEGGTDALAAPVEAVEPHAARAGADRRLRRRRDPRAAGPDGGAPRRLRAGRGASSAIPVERLLEHLEGMVERKLLRRVAAILFHRRAGFSANGMGVWKVPEDQIAEIGPRMAAVRGVSHCYRRPDLSRLALQRLHDGARALEGGVRRGARRRRAGLRAGRRGSRDALLLDRVQEGPAPLLHARTMPSGRRGIAERAARRGARHDALARAVRACARAHSRAA